MKKELFRFLIGLVLLVVLTGLGSALFLFGLELVTRLRIQCTWLLLLCPVLGLISAKLYAQFGRGTEGGNALVMRRLRENFAGGPQDSERVVKPIPSPLAPLIVLTTWLSHLGGASVGREGTAVQMGGALGDGLAHGLRLSTPRLRYWLVAAGVAAGFGSVFGVPWAGFLFALEMGGAFRLTNVAVDQEKKDPPKKKIGGKVELLIRSPFTILICLVSSFAADRICRATGIHHMSYDPWNWSLLFSDAHGQGSCVALVVASGIAFGGIAFLFLYFSRVFRKAMAKITRNSHLRPVYGGLLVAMLFFFPPLQRYLGLGTDVIKSSLSQPALAQDWIMKLLLTVEAIGSGFKGGEVTPLFFMGTTFGSWYGAALHFSPLTFASCGVVAVFAAACGAPIACAVMAAELMGWSILPLALVTCFISTGVCRTQRLYDEI